MSEAEQAVEDTRTCSCHPDDNPPAPCPRRHALRECREAALRPEVTAILAAIDRPNVGAIMLQGADLARLRAALRTTLQVIGYS
jgi:hypothetical protein